MNWTSVDKELPPTGVEVLVRLMVPVQDDILEVFYLAALDHDIDEWRSTEDYENLNHVTHWCYITTEGL